MADLYIKALTNTTTLSAGGKENINALFWGFDYFFPVIMYYDTSTNSF